MAKKKHDTKYWVRDVKTDSTHPPEGLFTKDAKTIARVMATKKVSPGGIGSGIRMIQYFINRSGKSLSAERRTALQEAKRILQTRARK
jgi:tRNA(adenine34) deaminase